MTSASAAWKTATCVLLTPLVLSAPTPTNLKPMALALSANIVESILQSALNVKAQDLLLTLAQFA
jgi:hypothetical protein